MDREIGMRAEKTAKLVPGDDREARRLQRHHRGGARAAVERYLSEVLARALRAENDVLAFLVAHVELHAAGDDDVQRVGLIAFADDDRIPGKTLDDALGGQLAQLTLAEMRPASRLFTHGGTSLPSCRIQVRRAPDDFIPQGWACHMMMRKQWPAVTRRPRGRHTAKNAPSYP